ncbi:MAG: uracil phosphoribosyltransferase [Clostridia bacterium]|nr:uracil phosphoribosyltransferase [Clostridia bacterium]
MKNLYDNVFVMEHPLIDHKVSHMCNIYTGSKEFAELTNEIAMLMGYEALKDLKTKNVTVQAPLAVIDTPVLAQDFTIVPILRAGLGMTDGLKALSPTAKIGHIGLCRNEETLEPETYYFKLPIDVTEGPVVVVDPALATGGSAVAAIDFIKKAGCKDIRFLCIFGSKTGVDLVHKIHPDVSVYIARYSDAPLNDKGYILTAAGDAGDRVCGTCSYKPVEN